MKLSTLVLAAAPNLAAVGATSVSDDISDNLCSYMVDRIYVNVSDYYDNPSDPICDSTFDDESGNTQCSLALQLEGDGTTCEKNCADIGYTCVGAYEDDNGQTCVVDYEVSCDTSLHSKICVCEGEEIVATTTAGDTTPVDDCSTNWGVKLKPGTSDPTEYEIDLYDMDALSGEYIISVRAYASSNYDGEEQLLHARFYDENGDELGYSTGGFPEERDVWETVSVTIDLGDYAPSSVELYFGYPVQSNHGKLLIRQLSLLDRKLNQYVKGGDLSCGENAEGYSEDNSRGDYKLKRADVEDLCFINQADIDGMCGDTVELSGSDGSYVSGMGFTAESCADACISFGGFTCNGFAVSEDANCHLFEDANECTNDNDKGTLDFYEMSLACGELITCDITVDNDLDAVYFNNVDITDSVIGFDNQDGYYEWNVKKTVSFRWDGIDKGVLAIAGHEFDADGSCGNSGLLLACSSDNVDSNWNFVKSDTSGAYLNGVSGNKNEDPLEDSAGREWYAMEYDASEWSGVCESSSSFWCCACCDEDGNPADITITSGSGEEAEKVWPCNCNTDAFFRVTVPGIEDLASEYLQCDWEEEHPDKELQGCTKDNCYDYATLSEAQRACEGYGNSGCGGISYNGAYETRSTNILIDSPSGESSWLMGSCDDREYDCGDGVTGGDYDFSSWKDSYGDSCETYAAYEFCNSDGSEGDGWGDTWGDFSDYTGCIDDKDSDSCFDATEVCCACGGGTETYTYQECYLIEDEGECLTSYDSRAEYASRCCVIDSRAGNGNQCEPQVWIEQNDLGEYATCPEDGLAGICAETCFGEVSCDYWIEFSDSFSCATLEDDYGCDCSGCTCPKTVNWRFVVSEVNDGKDQVQLTELSFVDTDGETMAFGESPSVNPGITNGKGLEQYLADGDPDEDQQSNCDPLPCTFQYELLDEPAGFQMGYADSTSRLPSLLLIQYKEPDTADWITVYAGEPEAPCGTLKDGEVCDQLSYEEISTEPLDNCPKTCFGKTSSCDDWIAISSEFTCQWLEEEHDCNCWRCACGSGTTAFVNLPEEVTDAPSCTWWNC
jgi:hypothetical protein